jgi:hypothetical protein
MKTKIDIFELITKALSELCQVMAYSLLYLYVTSLLFEIELNPSFILHEKWLLVGAITSAVSSTALKLWLLRNR